MLLGMSAVATVGSVGVGLVWGWLIKPVLPRLDDDWRPAEATRHALQVVASACLVFEIVVLDSPSAGVVFLVAASFAVVSRRIWQGRLQQMQSDREHN
jgi:hypothetical protein